MIKPILDNDDIVVEGEMLVGDKIHGLCCSGYDWEVSAILDSVWGNCSNPNCPAYDMTIGPDDHYRGVSHKDVFDIAEWMIGQLPCDHKTATVISDTEAVCTWGCGQTIAINR